MLARWWKDLVTLDRVNTASWSNVLLGRQLTEEEHFLFFMCRVWLVQALQALNSLTR
jgi:hypothetical protein